MRIVSALICLCAILPAMAEEPSSPKVIDLTAGQETPTPPRPRDGEWEWTRLAAPPEPPAKVSGEIAGRWILPGGDCRTPDLTLSADGKSGATQSHSTSDDGTGRKSSSSTYIYSYSSDGSADSAAKRRVDALLGGSPEPPPPTESSTSNLRPPPSRYAVLDGQLVVSSFGARRVYSRCDGDKPTRKWEME